MTKMSFNPSFSVGKIKITLHGLLRDALSVGIGILLMLLLTSDNLWAVLLGILITLVTGYVAVRDLIKLRWAIKYQFLAKNSIPSTKQDKLSKEKEDKVKSLMLFILKADYSPPSTDSLHHCHNESQLVHKTDIDNWQKTSSLEDKIMIGEEIDLKSLEKLQVTVYRLKKQPEKANPPNPTTRRWTN